MRRVLRAIALAIPVVVLTQAPADSVSPRAQQLHDRAIVVDAHDDTNSGRWGAGSPGDRLLEPSCLTSLLAEQAIQKIPES
jgi:hypothetical protein